MVVTKQTFRNHINYFLFLLRQSKFLQINLSQCHLFIYTHYTACTWHTYNVKTLITWRSTTINELRLRVSSNYLFIFYVLVCLWLYWITQIHVIYCALSNKVFEFEYELTKICKIYGCHRKQCVCVWASEWVSDWLMQVSKISAMHHG